MQTYNRLSVTILRKTAHRLQHDGYKYLVTDYSTPHTAFYTRYALRRWMRERGLRLGKRYGNGWGWRIEGSYSTEAVWDQRTFEKKRDSGTVYVTKTLSNGAYVDALIENGVVTTLNCNVRTRREFDYKAAQFEINPYPQVMTMAQR